MILLDRPDLSRRLPTLAIVGQTLLGFSIVFTYKLVIDSTKKNMRKCESPQCHESIGCKLADSSKVYNL